MPSFGRTFCDMFMTAASCLPLESSAPVVSLALLVSAVVTWMSERISKSLIFVHLVAATTIVVLIARGPGIVERIKNVEVEVEKRVVVKDDSEIRRLKDLLERSEELVELADGKLASASNDKDEAEAKLSALEASGADKDEKLAALEEAMQKKLKTKVDKEWQAELKRRRIAYNNWFLAQMDAWINQGLTQAQIQAQMQQLALDRRYWESMQPPGIVKFPGR